MAEYPSLNMEHYKRSFWKPEEGVSHNVILKYNGEEQKEFENEKNWHMRFLILQDGENRYDPPLPWSTGAKSFAEAFYKAYERQKVKGDLLFHFLLTYDKNRYSLVNLKGANPHLG